MKSRPVGITRENITRKQENKSVNNSLWIQPKLVVGSSDDVREKEADVVTNQVMRMPESGSIQRKCSECDREEKELKRKPLSHVVTPFLQAKNEGTVNDSVAHALQSSKGGGSPLDPQTNSFMSSRFGHDFSGVKVHTDSQSAQLNRNLNARAFTVGNDVYFNEGQYQPHSSDGKYLLAHELTHVVQQDESSVAPSIQRMLPCPSTLNEGEPVPAGFKAYHGASGWFHCGYRGILEDRTPSPEDPQNECFYDTLGRLVDENHPNAGCRGTPNDYDSATSAWDHTFKDRGGIWQRGWDAFWASRFATDDRTVPERSDPRNIQEECVVRLGGCPHSRPGGIPSSEEIEQYNERCRRESGYQGPIVTPECN